MFKNREAVNYISEFWHRLQGNKDAKALAGNFVWLSALKIVGYLFPLITIPYLARVIGVEGFGEIAFAVSVMVFIETLTDFGFNYTATRDIARCRDDKQKVSEIFSNVFWAKILLMTCGFVILCILIYSIPSFYDKRLLLFLTFLYIPGHIIFPDWFFQAMEQMKYITILNIVSKLIFTVLIFVVIQAPDDYVWQPLLTAAGYWVSGMIAMYFVVHNFHVRFFKPNWNNIWSSIKGSWNMFLCLILPNSYTNFSTILLRTTAGEMATGLYDAGMRFIQLVDQLFQILSRTFYPFLARRMDKHQTYVLISGFLSVCASLFLFFGADLLINIFYTPDFQPAVLVIKILSMAPISLFLMNTYGVNYLVLAGRERIYRNIILAVSAIGFITTWILTPTYGYIGTAITISGIWFLRGVATFICAYFVQNQQNKKNEGFSCR